MVGRKKTMEEPPNGWTMALNETAKTQYGIDHQLWVALCSSQRRCLESSRTKYPG